MARKKGKGKDKDGGDGGDGGDTDTSLAKRDSRDSEVFHDAAVDVKEIQVVTPVVPEPGAGAMDDSANETDSGTDTDGGSTTGGESESSGSDDDKKKKKKKKKNGKGKARGKGKKEGDEKPKKKKDYEQGDPRPALKCLNKMLSSINGERVGFSHILESREEMLEAYEDWAGDEEDENSLTVIAGSLKDIEDKLLPLEAQFDKISQTVLNVVHRATTFHEDWVRVKMLVKEQKKFVKELKSTLRHRIKLKEKEDEEFEKEKEKAFKKGGDVLEKWQEKQRQVEAEREKNLAYWKSKHQRQVNQMARNAATSSAQAADAIRPGSPPPEDEDEGGSEPESPKPDMDGNEGGKRKKKKKGEKEKEPPMPFEEIQVVIEGAIADTKKRLEVLNKDLALVRTNVNLQKVEEVFPIMRLYQSTHAELAEVMLNVTEKELMVFRSISEAVGCELPAQDEFRQNMADAGKNLGTAYQKFFVSRTETLKDLKKFAAAEGERWGIFEDGFGSTPDVYKRFFVKTADNVRVVFTEANERFANMMTREQKYFDDAVSYQEQVLSETKKVNKVRAHKYLFQMNRGNVEGKLMDLKKKVWVATWRSDTLVKTILSSKVAEIKNAYIMVWETLLSKHFLQTKLEKKSNRIINPSSLTEDQHHQLSQVFRWVDKDGSGTIGRDELEAHLAMFKADAALGGVDELMAKLGATAEDDGAAEVSEENFIESLGAILIRSEKDFDHFIAQCRYFSNVERLHLEAISDEDLDFDNGDLDTPVQSEVEGSGVG